MYEAKSLNDLAAAGTARIQRIERDGHVFWIKRPEVLSRKMRLQKGDPKTAFAEEVAAHHDFLRLKLPVPTIVSEGPGFIITNDAGPNLKSLFAQLPETEFLKALSFAARALTGLHSAGVSHGRPSLKDICWRDGKITFLDFERAADKRNGKKGQAMDLLILLFSTSVETRGSETAMATVRNAYLDAGSDDIWRLAQRRVRLLGPLRVLLRPIAWVLRGNKEFDAIAPFFDFVRGDGG